MSYKGTSLSQLEVRSILTVLFALLLSLNVSAVACGAEKESFQTSPRMLYSAKSFEATQEDKKTRTLEPGKPIEGELAGGEAHSYELNLTAGQYLHLVVDQRGVDVTVVFLGPDGTKLLEVDTPNGTQGPESVTVVAEAAGRYRLEVRSPDQSSTRGRYEVKIENIRPATQQDRMRIRAEQAFTEAEGLRAQGKPDAIQRAIEKYDVALSAYRALSDLGEQGKISAAIGTSYGALHDTRKALEYFERGLLLFQAAGDRDREAHLLNDIGVFYKTVGDFQMALNHFGRALSIFRSIGDRTKEARTRRIIGEVYESIGEKQKAIDYYNQALAIFQSVGDKSREAWTLYNLGFAYRTAGEGQLAIDPLNRALSLYQALGDRPGEASTLIEIAYTYIILNERQKALDLFAQVRSLFKTLNDAEGEAYVLHGIGVVYRDLGEREKTLEYFNQALSVWRTVGNPSGEFMTLYQVARAERANGSLLAARSDIEAVLNHIEAQRGKINSQEFRASYFAAQQELYEFYVSLLMQLHKQQPSQRHDATALQASERARARSLLELLTEARANIREDVDPALLEREGGLQQQLTTKAERLMRLRGNVLSKEQTYNAKQELETVEKEIEALTVEHQQVRAQIRIKSPRYADLTQPSTLSLKEIQQLLDPDTLLLEYALGVEQSYLWAITPTTLQSFELPKRAEVEALAKRVYQLLTARSRRPVGEPAEARLVRLAAVDAEYVSAAGALSKMLLQDVSDQLRSKRLLIVGDGALQYIPFAALPEPASNNELRAVANVPLLVNHEVVNLPSASTLSVLRQDLSKRKPAAKAVAILADPVFDKDDPRINTSGATALQPATQAASLNANVRTRDIERAMEDLEGNPRFPPVRLTAAGWEAEEISKLVPAKERMQALDFAANRRMATSPELSQYRIVHFATHAFINSAHPELSGIVLSLVNERGEPQDGFLSVSEIFNLKLPAELVVLSACQTGLGKEVKGEGMIGMTRAFMYAGALRMVVSLWSVDDRATSAMMARFYKKMLRGQKQPPSAALRAAQLAMWKETGWKAPYYWAGFIFQGEWKQMSAN